MIKKNIIALIEKFPAVAGNLRNFKEVIDAKSTPIKTPWGFMLDGHKEMASGSFEPEETVIVQSLLNEVEVFINIGANIGYYCCHALALDKSVIAVEPNTRNLQYLLRNIRINGWSKNAQVFPLALGSGTDVLEMWGTGTGASLIKGWASNPESLVKLVPISTLDRVLGNEINNKKSLILVDIEGAESMMLQGALDTLSNNIKPIWLVEIATTEHQPAGVQFNPNFLFTFELFFRHGYSAFAVNDLERQIGMDEILKVIKNGLKFKTNNFVFR